MTIDRALVEEQFDPFNAGDLDRYERLYHPDIVWSIPGEVLRGRAVVVERHRRDLAAMPGVRDVVRRIVIEGRTAAVDHEVVLPVVNPAGTSEVRWTIFSFLVFADDGRLLEDRSVWDRDGVRTLLRNARHTS